MLTRERLGELVDELAALPPAERGAVPGIKPGRGDIILAAALTIEAVLEAGGSRDRGDRGRAARGGVLRPRAARRQREPLFDDVRDAAVRNLAIQYEADMAHVEHVARLSLQMFDSLVAAGCSSRPRASASCCGPPRCSTTSG